MSENPDEKRDCPDCGVEMDCHDTGYVLLWECNADDCGNFEGYWSVYDWEIYGQVKLVQSQVGQKAAERLAGEFKDGVLS